MQTPLEIAFHNTPASPEIEGEIRAQVNKLERIYDRLVGCRVSIEALHKQHRTGNLYEVHIRMRVPGGELAVSREPHHAKDRYATPNLHTSLRDAFKAAQSRLKQYKRQLQGVVKPEPEMLVAQVARLFPRRGYGFLLTSKGENLYFHRNSVMNGAFDRLKRGDAVHYVESMGDTGPTASKVWVAAESDSDSDT